MPNLFPITRAYIVHDITDFSQRLMTIPKELKVFCDLTPMKDRVFQPMSGGCVLAPDCGMMQTDDLKQTAERLFLLKGDVLAFSCFANYKNRAHWPLGERYSLALDYNRHGFPEGGNLNLTVVGPKPFWTTLSSMGIALVVALDLERPRTFFKAAFPSVPENH